MDTKLRIILSVRYFVIHVLFSCIHLKYSFRYCVNQYRAGIILKSCGLQIDLSRLHSKRYGLQALAGVPSVDDDGNAAVQHAKPAYKPTKAIKDSLKMIQVAYGNNDEESVKNELTGLKPADKKYLWSQLNEDQHNWITSVMGAGK